MRFNGGRGRRAAVAAVLVGTLALAACSGGGEGGGEGDGGSDGPVNLVVDNYGNFGYTELYRQFEAEHPNITIEERNVQRIEDYLPRLEQWIATGSGAGDVVALEEGFILRFLNQPDAFVDLRDHGAGELEDNFLPWKWNAGMALDGSKLIGLGTDIGTMGMCYRRDLFQAAGLPTDREEVSKLWPEWEDYLAVGEQFMAKNTGPKFVDAATNLYNTILMQRGDHTYFDRDDNLVMDSNPAVREAWDLTVQMIQAGLSANLEAFTPPWNTAFKQGSFATIACPAWMLGVIEEQAGPENARKWDVAAVPGGGGNWGGSHLAVPEQSEHPEEAAELVKFLTSPEGQTAAFEAANTFPSSPQAIDSPEVQQMVSEYFSNAPVGQIFGEGAKQIEPVFLGVENQPVREEVEDRLRAVEQGQLRPDQAWQEALKAAEGVAR
jgi:ABC-type glycerol-3-phosphate transport system substrate-binding protein